MLSRSLSCPSSSDMPSATAPRTHPPLFLPPLRCGDIRSSRAHLAQPAPCVRGGRLQRQGARVPAGEAMLCRGLRGWVRGKQQRDYATSDSSSNSTSPFSQQANGTALAAVGILAASGATLSQQALAIYNQLGALQQHNNRASTFNDPQDPGLDVTKQGLADAANRIIAAAGRAQRAGMRGSLAVLQMQLMLPAANSSAATRFTSRLSGFLGRASWELGVRGKVGLATTTQLRMQAVQDRKQSRPRQPPGCCASVRRGVVRGVAARARGDTYFCQELVKETVGACPDVQTSNTFMAEFFQGKWYEIGSTAESKLEVSGELGMSCVTYNFVFRGINHSLNRFSVVKRGIRMTTPARQSQIQGLSKSALAVRDHLRSVCTAIARPPAQGSSATLQVSNARSRRCRGGGAPNDVEADVKVALGDIANSMAQVSRARASARITDTAGADPAARAAADGPAEFVADEAEARERRKQLQRESTAINKGRVSIMKSAQIATRRVNKVENKLGNLRGNNNLGLGARRGAHGRSDGINAADGGGCQPARQPLAMRFSYSAIGAVTQVEASQISFRLLSRSPSVSQADVDSALQLLEQQGSQWVDPTLMCQPSK
ncbi:unnamed protein product [Closterium sp. NIES-64]|nr:unnamed protein product [Closterium sp. NIES-64]